MTTELSLFLSDRKVNKYPLVYWEMKITTIKLSDVTKNRLENLKIHRKETYDEVLQHMLAVLNMCKVNPHEARRMLEEINRRRETNKSPIFSRDFNAEK